MDETSMPEPLPDTKPYLERCGRGTAWIGKMIEAEMRRYAIDYAGRCVQGVIEEAARTLVECLPPGESVEQAIERLRRQVERRARGQER